MTSEEPSGFTAFDYEDGSVGIAHVGTAGIRVELVLPKTVVERLGTTIDDVIDMFQSDGPVVAARLAESVITGKPFVLDVEFEDFGEPEK